MIKKIHHLWFGEKNYSQVHNICLLSWNQHLLDNGWELVSWDLEKVKKDPCLSENPYCKECISNKAWMLLSNFVRLYSIYKEGGLYLDCDVQVFCDLTHLFESYDVGIGFNTKAKKMNPAMIYCKPGNSLIKYFIDNYLTKNLKKSGMQAIGPSYYYTLLSQYCQEDFSKLEEEVKILDGRKNLFIGQNSKFEVTQEGIKVTAPWGDFTDVALDYLAIETIHWGEFSWKQEDTKWLTHE